MAHNLHSKIEVNKNLEDFEDDLNQTQSRKQELRELCDVSIVTQLISNRMRLKPKSLET